MNFRRTPRLSEDIRQKDYKTDDCIVVKFEFEATRCLENAI